MNRTSTARVLRALLVACCIAVVLVVVTSSGTLVLTSEQFAVWLPFVGIALAAIGLGLARSRIDRLVERLTHHRDVTPYSVLAAAAGRLRAGSLEQALPGLAEVLAGGTGAARAVVWLAVGDRLVNVAEHPHRDLGEPGADVRPGTVENLAVLLASPDTDYLVPVIEGTALRAALVIEKPGAAITPADQLLMQDVANGAGLLLRGIALNAELAERVRRADELATELQASRQQLTRAQEMERKRLVMELSHATGARLTALRSEISVARADLDARPVDSEGAQEALARARIGLDDLLDRFRVIARGVYPAVLRDQGPTSALEEVAADLPRSVQLTGGLPVRLAWEIESGIYYVAAAAMQQLAGCACERELVMLLEQADGRISVVIDDPSSPVTLEQLRAALADDVERLAALGGDLELSGFDASGGEGTTALEQDGPTPRPNPGSAPAASVRLRAWLPDRLEPIVESSVGAELRMS